MFIPKQYAIKLRGGPMEHNPFVALNDNTEITYSDIKRTKQGQEYITLYFETPAGGDC